MKYATGLVRRTSMLLGASAAALGCALVPSAALAQAAASTAAPAGPVASSVSGDGVGGLDTIVVTARKIAENLQDVPISVTVLSGADLINRNIQQVQDIANFTPGLRMGPASSTSLGLTIALRGQIQTDVLATLDPSVGIYVDGVYWARAYGLNSNLLDVSAVQVLKGPQGTLFGRNTTGGALLINTNDPDTHELSGRLSVTYGRYNELETTGVVNIPIVDGKVALRVAATRLTRDGYTTNVAPATATTALVGNTVVAKGPYLGSQNGVKFDNRDRWNARAKLLVRPTETFSLLFSGEYFDADERGPARQIIFAPATFDAATATPTNPVPNSTYSVSGTAGLFAGLVTGNPPATAEAAGTAILNAQAAQLAANPKTVSSNERNYNAARTYTYGVTAALDVPWGEVKLIAAHRDVRAFAGVDLDGSPFPIHFTEGQQRLKQTSGELQTTGKLFDGAVDFAAGAFAFHEKGYDQSISIALPALNPATSHFYGLIDNDSMGVYGQATWHITDRLGFTGGLRYSIDDKGLEIRNNNYLRPSGTTICSVIPAAPFVVATEVVGPTACAVARHDSFAGVSYTAGLDFKLTDDILIYAKTSKGFRSGGENLRAPTTSTFLPFAPEIAYSYEVGFKGEFFDRRIRLNAAGYLTDVNDIQRTTLIAAPPTPPSTVATSATILGNAGKARFKGFEVEAQAVVFEGFLVSGSFALIDPSYVRFSDLSGDRSSERFVGIAKRQFSLAADYSREVGSKAKLNLHADYSWRSDTPSGEYYFPANPQNQQIIDATTVQSLGLLGARVSVNYDERFEVALFGRNITNERKYVADLFVAPLGYVSGTRQEPATYGISGTVKF